MTTNLINISSLREWLNVKHVSKIIEFLDENKIKYWLIGTSPVTTQQQIDAAFSEKESGDIEF